MKISKEKLFSYLRNLLLGLFASLTALAFSLPNTNINLAIVTDAGYLNPDHGYGWILFVRIFSLALNLFVVAFPFFYFDNLDLFNKKEYFHSENKKHLLLEPRCWIYLGISLTFAGTYFSSTIKFLFSHFFEMKDGLCILLSFVIFISLRALQIHLLKNKWDNEILYPHLKARSAFKRNSNMETFKVRQLIWQPLGFFVIGFLVCFFILSILLTFLYPIFLLFTLPDAWIYLIFAVVILSAVPATIYFIHNIRARRKLLGYLKRLEKDRVATVKINGHKLVSAFFPSWVLELHITDRKGRKYNVCVISCGKMGTPMYFRENQYMLEKSFRINSGALMSARPGVGFAQAVDVSKLGGDENPTNKIFGYYRAFDLSFPDTEGKKCVILNPTPTKAFMLDESNKPFPIDTGMKVFDYTVYTATGFHNTLNLD